MEIGGLFYSWKWIGCYIHGSGLVIIFMLVSWLLYSWKWVGCHIHGNGWVVIFMDDIFVHDFVSLNYLNSLFQSVIDRLDS